MCLQKKGWQNHSSPKQVHFSNPLLPYFVKSVPINRIQKRMKIILFPSLSLHSRHHINHPLQLLKLLIAQEENSVQSLALTSCQPVPPTQSQRSSPRCSCCPRSSPASTSGCQCLNSLISPHWDLLGWRGSAYHGALMNRASLFCFILQRVISRCSGHLWQNTLPGGTEKPSKN